MEDKEALEMVDVENIDPKLLATIEKKVADLKENNPKAKIVPLVVEGEPDFDEKEAYVGYFSRPSFINFSKYLSLSQKDQANAMRQLARDCFVDGDRELIDDDDLFLFGLMGQLQHLIKMRGGRLVNLSKPGK
ncbi:hypothetical protein [Xylanibacter muris]|jgi:hypothetical protein|uniref:hypothetical protein n=1 Tax=Bacteroidales TaxID=171549 RepID=UPI000FFE8628|nr:hypothetical protein [Xylanibacter muris]RXE72190.1 hypothetical protein ED352_01680 [Muribaculaceae bacterium Isolate-002 (NCI)]